MTKIYETLEMREEYVSGEHRLFFTNSPDEVLIDLPFLFEADHFKVEIQSLDISPISIRGFIWFHGYRESLRYEVTGFADSFQRIAKAKLVGRDLRTSGPAD